MSTFGAILRMKTDADVLVQFDKAALVLRTTDKAYARMTRSLKLRDLRFLKNSTSRIDVDARVSDDELTIEDSTEFWPLRYLGTIDVGLLRIMAVNGGKLSVPAADDVHAGEEAFIQLTEGDARELLIYLDELEEKGHLVNLQGFGGLRSWDPFTGRQVLQRHHDLSKYGYVFKVSHLKNRHGEVTDTIVSVTHRAEYKRSGDDKVASVDFSHMPDGTLVAERVEVGTHHRRRGLATQMYKLAQEATGKTIVPSSSQTGAGARLWEGLRERRSLGGLSQGFFNARRKYHLTGDVWQGKSILQSNQRLTLERFDASRDSAFFLYRRDGGLIGRVHERTVARPNKWVIFKKGKYGVRVLRADLLTALEALA